jgi:hypothetical protein
MKVCLSAQPLAHEKSVDLPSSSAKPSSRSRCQDGASTTSTTRRVTRKPSCLHR